MPRNIPVYTKFRAIRVTPEQDKNWDNNNIRDFLDGKSTVITNMKEQVIDSIKKLESSNILKQLLRNYLDELNWLVDLICGLKNKR